VIICDTTPLVAAAVRNDRNNAASRVLFERLRARGQLLLVPPTVLAEAGYLIDKYLGADAEVEFLNSFTNGEFELAEMVDDDMTRIAELCEKYRDLPLGVPAASVVAIAERLKIKDVATFDRKHFSVVRPAHCRAFNLLP